MPQLLIVLFFLVLGYENAAVELALAKVRLDSK